MLPPNVNPYISILPLEFEQTLAAIKSASIRGQSRRMSDPLGIMAALNIAAS